MAKDKFIGAWTTPETVDRLKALAKLQGTSQSEVIRRLVESAAAKVASANDPPEANVDGEMQIAPGYSLEASGAIAA